MKSVLSFVIKAVFILLVGVVGFFVPKNIAIPQAHAQTCTTPTQVQNVSISFPYENGAQVNFTQANCTWTALTGATQYQVLVTNATTNTQVLSQQVAGTVVSQVFSVQDNNTYTCTVNAINSCGTSGPSNSFSLLCKVDAMVSSPTPAPTTPPSAPQPTLAPTGAFENTLMVGLGVIVFLVGGVFLMLL